MELNEGSHCLTLTRKMGSESTSIRATISLKIYNPINGRPEEFKVPNNPKSSSLHQRLVQNQYLRVLGFQLLIILQSVYYYLLKFRKRKSL